MSKIKIVDISQQTIPTFKVEKDEYIVFRNLDNLIHQINSVEGEFFFDIGLLHPGEVSSPILFYKESGPDGFSYGCGLHPDMEGKIYVGAPIPAPPIPHPHDPGHAGHHPGHPEPGHEQLKHFHGFVTGGSTGEQIFMTHTPIFADERHHFQIILQGRFAEKTHIDAYNQVRLEYGQGLFQTFFDHLALIDIRDGKLTELTTDVNRGARKYPGGKPVNIQELNNAKIIITKVLHFRTFDPDMDYPEHLRYLMYGNEKDVFIDHFISRAPNFHSVARLATTPSIWKKEYYESVLPFEITSKRMIDVSPKQIKRAAFVDNRFHLLWGAPSNSATPSDPLGPLNEGATKTFPIKLDSGEAAEIEISHLLHFDAIRLLNEGLGY
ncbi:hypothetical protein ACLI09_02685 [Flavobacterium sp. RHBU_24]|uniref:cupredoxin domain-containing protein n=1 Tax=Flavobacterium sp. RHBU_24 TaxID=3391185 RepID=UPI003984D6D6